MRILLVTLLFAHALYAACSKMAMPTDFAAVTSGTRANLKANFTEAQTKFNPCADSVDEVRARLSGYSGSLLITSLENFRLKLDLDGTATGKFLVENSNGDSLFRVSEDSTAKFFGGLTVAGTSTFTGATTHTALTASLPVVTNGSKVLTSATVTGTGTTVVMSAAPTGTGLWTLSGGLTVADSIRLTGRLNILNSQAETFLTSSTAGNPAFMKLTANGAIGYIAKEGTTGTDFMTGGTAGALQLVTATNVPVEVGVNGAKVATYASTGPTFTGTTTVTTVSASGNVTADSLISSKFYTEGTFTGTLTGCTTSPTGTFSYVRVGKQVTLKIPDVTGTSNTSAMTITGLPAAITPAADISLGHGKEVDCEDNTMIDVCMVLVTSTGTLKYAAPTGGSFTGFTTSGVKGVGRSAYGVLQFFTYTLQ